MGYIAFASSQERLTGAIERVTFHSPESGFCVLRIKAKCHRDLVTVVGHAAVATVGEYLEAEGQWYQDKKHGLQFKADAIRMVAPNTLAGIEKYLGSGLIRGIGPHYAKKLVMAFGETVLTVIEDSPKQLLELPGIGQKRYKQIIACWQEQKAIRHIMVFLQSHGVGTTRAVRIYKTYRDAAIAKIKDNPYCLAQDIHGIGFKTADVLAQRLGMSPTALPRARAGLHHVLQTLCREGHCAIPVRKLIEASVALLEIPEAILWEAIQDEVTTKELIIDKLEEECIALASLYHAEEGIASQVMRLLPGKPRWINTDVAALLQWMQNQTGRALSDSQEKAVAYALQCKVMILTGGPGVGKTTVIRTILEIVLRYTNRISLCAPTGRAAKRLSESTGLTAKTIHRLLEFDPKTHQFRFNAQHPLPIELLVLDEASMVDTLLMYQLLKAIPSSASLLIVGDEDQLPSVGSGTVLHDLLQSRLMPVVRLTEIFRQAATSQIITNAHRINHGLFPREVLEGTDIPKDFYFIEANTPEAIHEKLLRLVVERIPQAFQVNPVTDIQLLSPMQRGTLGVRALNLELQQRLNGHSAPRLTRFGMTFAPGDKVLQTVNNYDKDIFNGDIGCITRIDLEEGEVHIQFDHKTAVYDFDELDEISLAYAITIHKSQGSEYPVVVLPLSTQHYMMLQRNLLYTGMTRGKKLVVIVGQKKALAMAVKNDKHLQRLTFLPAHLARKAALLLNPG